MAMILLHRKFQTSPYPLPSNPSQNLCSSTALMIVAPQEASSFEKTPNKGQWALNSTSCGERACSEREWHEALSILVLEGRQAVKITADISRRSYK